MDLDLLRSVHVALDLVSVVKLLGVVFNSCLQMKMIIQPVYLS